jgi:hypothetical protein
MTGAATEDKTSFITVQLLGSGYAAIHWSWYAEDDMWDVTQTGIGRYKTYAEAEEEARIWSESDEIRLRL